MSANRERLIETFARLQDLLWINDLKGAHQIAEETRRESYFADYFRISEKAASILKKSRQGARDSEKDKGWMAEEFVSSIGETVPLREIAFSGIASRIGYLQEMLAFLLEETDLKKLPSIYFKNKFRYVVLPRYDSIEIRALLNGTETRNKKLEFRLPRELSDSGFRMSEPVMARSGMYFSLSSSDTFVETVAVDNQVRLTIRATYLLKMVTITELAELVLGGIS
jgi:hypothetical protein